MVGRADGFAGFPADLEMDAAFGEQAGTREGVPVGQAEGLARLPDASPVIDRLPEIAPALLMKPIFHGRWCSPAGSVTPMRAGFNAEPVRAETGCRDGAGSLDFQAVEPPRVL